MNERTGTTQRVISCRCPQDDPAPGTTWHCAVHDRSNRPLGPVLRGEHDPRNPPSGGNA